MKSMSASNEARQRSRVHCSALVEVRTGDNRRVVRGRLRDVGLQSLYLFTDESNDSFLIEGERVKVKVSMKQDSSTLSIEIEGWVSRMDETGIVVQFDSALRWWPVFIIFPGAREH